MPPFINAQLISGGSASTIPIGKVRFSGLLGAWPRSAGSDPILTSRCLEPAEADAILRPREQGDLNICPRDHPPKAVGWSLVFPSCLSQRRVNHALGQASMLGEPTQHRYTVDVIIRLACIAIA